MSRERRFPLSHQLFGSVSQNFQVLYGANFSSMEEEVKHKDKTRAQASVDSGGLNHLITKAENELSRGLMYGRLCVQTMIEGKNSPIKGTAGNEVDIWEDEV